MPRNEFRLVLAGLIVAVGLSPVTAQPVEVEGKRRPPETALEFWRSINEELDVGRNDLAARYLNLLLQKKPADKDLLALLDKVGLTPILQLRNIAKWSDDDAEDKQAKADAQDLLGRVGAANRRRAGDLPWTRDLVSKLLGTPLEKEYARDELAKAGGAGVPSLVAAYLSTTDARSRLVYRQALANLNDDALPPMLATLDSDATLLKLDLLAIIRQKYARYRAEIVPFLWYVLASPGQPKDVRDGAMAMLAEFLRVDPSRLPSPKVALTREAEKFLDKKIVFKTPAGVSVWRWDGRAVVRGFPKAATIPAAQAETYYGLRYAQAALALDPSYRPAQLVALTLAVEQAIATPAVATLLAKADPDLVLDMLARALDAKRTGVVIAAIRSLGERAEGRAKLHGRDPGPALALALYYPDAAVRLSAALAWERIAGAAWPKADSRVLEILAENAGSSEEAFRLVADRAAKGIALADRRAAVTAVAAGVRGGKVSESALNAGLAALTQADGEAAQTTLAAIVLDEKARPATRAAAAKGLLLSLQRQGPVVPRATALALRASVAKPAGDGELREQLENLRGAFRPTSRESGESLREKYRFDPRRPKLAK